MKKIHHFLLPDYTDSKFTKKDRILNDKKISRRFQLALCLFPLSNRGDTVQIQR